MDPKEAKNAHIKEGNLLFLGTGGSLGVPIVACSCAVCQSSHPKNKRLRSSVLLQIRGKHLLIDAGPDFRLQALHYHLDSLDAVLLTHGHRDHIAGVDELRAYQISQKCAIPCFMSRETAEELQTRYAYFNQQGTQRLLTTLEYHLLPSEEGFIDCLGLQFHYFSYKQGSMKVTGVRIGDLAYVCDLQTYPPSVLELLKGLKTLVLGALYFDPVRKAVVVDRALQFASLVGAEVTWLTHISHELDAEKVLQPGVKLAYDGLTLPFQVES